MPKIAFMFPGQGAQYTGMGQDFYEKIPESRAIFEKASQVTGMDLPELCFTENEKLNVTAYTQIAILTASAAILEAVKSRGIISQVNAGLSLGEYGALTASGVLTFEDAARVVVKRGQYMQEAVPTGGAMSAVLGMDAGRIEEVLEKTPGIVSVANYNCPGQIVITGEAGAVAEASGRLKAAGAKRILPLKVSGPFHSALLKDAGERLSKVLEQVEIRDIRIPYLTNVTADYVTDKEMVRELLKQQISSPVRWQQSVERMLADGVDTFLEIGPGRTLSGFVKKISREAKAYSIQTTEDLEKLDLN